jgi:hypothetical protein
MVAVVMPTVVVVVALHLLQKTHFKETKLANLFRSLTVGVQQKSAEKVVVVVVVVALVAVVMGILPQQ